MPTLIEHLAKLDTTLGMRPSNGSDTFTHTIHHKTSYAVYQAILKWHWEHHGSSSLFISFAKFPRIISYRVYLLLQIWSSSNMLLYSV